MKTVADRRRLAAYDSKHCRRAFQWYQHRWPWTTLNPQNRGFKWFFAILGCDAHLEWIFAEIHNTGDRPRQPAYEIKLMLWRVSWALAQISCPHTYDRGDMCAQHFNFATKFSQNGNFSTSHFVLFNEDLRQEIFFDRLQFSGNGKLSICPLPCTTQLKSLRRCLKTKSDGAELISHVCHL